MDPVLYGRLDVDDAGKKLEALLRTGDAERAVAYQRKLQQELQGLERSLADDLGAEILFAGCDDILFRAPLTTGALLKLNELVKDFANRATCTISGGVGVDVFSAIESLRRAKAGGKACIVVDDTLALLSIS